MLEYWIDRTATAIAFAITTATSVIDFSAAIIDGVLPPHIRERLVAGINAHLADFDRRGPSPIVVLEGTIGRDACAIGGACLPILASFARDREVLFKEQARLRCEYAPNNDPSVGFLKVVDSASQERLWMGS